MRAMFIPYSKVGDYYKFNEALKDFIQIEMEPTFLGPNKFRLTLEYAMYPTFNSLLENLITTKQLNGQIRAFNNKKDYELINKELKNFEHLFLTFEFDEDKVISYYFYLNLKVANEFMNKLEKFVYS
jgi:hypothetical protein